MSSKILRAALVQPEPLLIENALDYQSPELSSVEDYEADLPELAEELLQEHPDAEPDMIEDALQEAIEQLLQEDEEPLVELPAEGADESELTYLEQPESELAALQLEDDGTDTWQEEEPPAILLPAAEPAVDTGEVLAQARQTAEEILEAARVEAAEVLREGDARAAEIERASYDKGYEEGFAAGKLVADEQAARDLSQVASIVDQAAELHDQMLHEAESEMVALSLEIARKILQAEVRTNPEVVQRVLAAAVQKINGGPRVTIKVNPADVQRLSLHWANTYGPNYRDKEWAIEGDEAVAVGGVVLESRYGMLDAQIGSQFDEIQKAFALLLGTES